MIDLLNDKDLDLDIANGDIVLAESQFQIQQDLLLSAKGDYHNSPVMGVDSISYIKGNSTAEYLRTIRQQLTLDGQVVKSISLSPQGVLTIDSE